jgi:hypothetical protein
MDYSKFFKYYKCDYDLWSERSDKVGVVTLVATKKNLFYREGEMVSIGIFKNHAHGRMFSVSPVRDFMDYFGAGNDFIDFLFDLWEKNKPSTYRYE